MSLLDSVIWRRIRDLLAGGGGEGGGGGELLDNSVTMAKLADLATDRVIGRDTAGTGDPQSLTVGGGLEFTGSGGIQRSALTGDVTAPAGSNVLTLAAGLGGGVDDGGVTTVKLADDAVTLAKLADLATDRLLGRDTAGTGDPEALTVGGGLEFSGAGGIQRSALTGDVTAATGSNATTLAPVSNAKLATVATATVKGRATAGTGAPEDLTGTQATALLDVATTSLKGLQSAADKTKLDGVATGATALGLSATTPTPIGTAAAVGVGTAAARSDHAHAPPANVVAAGAAGLMTGADKTKLDGVATGATANTLAVSSTAPADVGAAAAVGVGGTAARADHVHAHGAQAGGTTHANAVAGGAAGFLSGADKTKLDGVAAGAVGPRTLAQTLATGNATGANNAVVSMNAGTYANGFAGASKIQFEPPPDVVSGFVPFIGFDGGASYPAVRVHSGGYQLFFEAGTVHFDAISVAFTGTPVMVDDPVSGNNPATKDYVDIAVGGVAVADDSITFAKMQNIATARLLGRTTAATGNPEEISLATSLEFSGSTLRRSALTGDVTAPAGSNATTLANDAVTYAKLQNVAAASRLLGRGSAAGAGDPEELAIGSGLSVSGTTVALYAAAAGQTWVYWNAVWYQMGALTGADLTDADQTLQVGTGCQYFLAPSTLTATRAKTLGTTGASVGVVVTIVRLGYSGTAAQVCNVVNGGAGGGTAFSFPASAANPIEASFRYDGTNWTLASWRYLSAPVAR